MIPVSGTDVTASFSRIDERINQLLGKQTAVSFNTGIAELENDGNLQAVQRQLRSVAPPYASRKLSTGR